MPGMAFDATAWLKIVSMLLRFGIGLSPSECVVPDRRTTIAEAARPATSRGRRQLIAGSRASQRRVSRRLECYRARIVAPLAMLLSAAYGESHCECARQGRVRASHLSTLPTRKAPGEATDP